MKRIRKYLIHLLGGVTEEEALFGVQYAIRRTWLSASKCVLIYMRTCYGLQPDEWCKKVYGHALKTHERAEKELAQFLDAHPNEEMEVSDERN